MTQKVSTIVGISTESFADAAAKAISASAKTIRGVKWARVKDLEMEVDGARVKTYRATIDVYFDIEGR